MIVVLFWLILLLIIIVIICFINKFNKYESYSSNCELPDRTVCSNRGEPIMPFSTTRKCTCFTGAIGDICDQLDKSLCSNNGVPVNVPFAGKCTCDTGALGDLCNQPDRSLCNGRGNPILPYRGTCTCDKEYGGNTCFQISSVACDYGGFVQGIPGITGGTDKNKCVCFTGRAGDLCVQDVPVDITTQTYYLITQNILDPHGAGEEYVNNTFALVDYNNRDHTLNILSKPDPNSTVWLGLSDFKFESAGNNLYYIYSMGSNAYLYYNINEVTSISPVGRCIYLRVDNTLPPGYTEIWSEQYGGWIYRSEHGDTGIKPLVDPSQAHRSKFQLGNISNYTCTISTENGVYSYYSLAENNLPQSVLTESQNPVRFTMILVTDPRLFLLQQFPDSMNEFYNYEG